MIGVATVVYLVMCRAPENINQFSWPSQPDVGVPEVISQENEHKSQYIPSQDCRRAEFLTKQKVRKAQQNTSKRTVDDIVKKVVDGMLPVVGERMHHRGRVVDFMKFPEKRNFVLHVVNKESQEIRQDH